MYSIFRSSKEVTIANDPEKLILPESMARKIFGKQSAVGKALHAEEQNNEQECKGFYCRSRL